MPLMELRAMEHLVGHKDEVKGLRMVKVPDGGILYSASKDKKVFSWDLQSAITSEFGKILKLYDGGHQKRINGLDVSINGDMMVTVGSDLIGRIWDTKSKKSVVLSGHNRDVLCTSINGDGTKIVTGSADKTINLYNTVGDLVSTIKEDMPKAHQGWINCVAFHPTDENVLASGSTDGTVKIWDVSGPEHLYTYMDGVYVDYMKAEETKTKLVDYDESKSVTALAFSRDGSILAYGEKSGKMHLVKLDTKEGIQSFDAMVPIRCIATGETDPVIAIGTDESVIIWGAMESRVITSHNLKTDGNGVKCLSLVFSGNILYCGLSTGRIVPFELRRSD